MQGHRSVNLTTISFHKLSRACTSIRSILTGYFPACPILSYGVVEQRDICIITLMGALHHAVASQLYYLLTKYAAGRQPLLVCLQDVCPVSTLSARQYWGKLNSRQSSEDSKSPWWPPAGTWWLQSSSGILERRLS